MGYKNRDFFLYRENKCIFCEKEFENRKFGK